MLRLLKIYLVLVAFVSGFAYMQGRAEARNSLVELFVDQAHCIAINIYHESLWEPVLGKYAVAYVVMNRVRDTKFPDDACDVIYEGPTQKSWKDPNVTFPRRHKCQFSWYCDGKSDEVTNLELYEECFKIALHVMTQYGTSQENDPTDGALWYHADYVDPDWNDIYKEHVKIGRHIFYGRP